MAIANVSAHDFIFRIMLVELVSTHSSTDQSLRMRLVELNVVVTIKDGIIVASQCLSYCNC